MGNLLSSQAGSGSEKKSMSLLYIELTNWNLRGSLSSQTKKKISLVASQSPTVKVKHGSYLSGPWNSSAVIKFLPAPNFRCQSPVRFTTKGIMYLRGERGLSPSRNWLGNPKELKVALPYWGARPDFQMVLSSSEDEGSTNPMIMPHQSKIQQTEKGGI